MRLTLQAVGTAATLLMGIPAEVHAADPHIRQQCIAMREVDHTRVIDGRTILVVMKRDAYKRIDLMTRCLGLATEQTFSYTMQTYELCTSTPLRVVNGGTCLIDKIVDIGADEAKALRVRK